jgi:rubrerythrin
MTEDRELIERKLLAILEEAIEDEKLSAARYRHGAKLAVDPELKEMFDRLVDDEIQHEKVLKDQYYEIKKRLGLKIISGTGQGS